MAFGQVPKPAIVAAFENLPDPVRRAQLQHRNGHRLMDIYETLAKAMYEAKGCTRTSTIPPGPPTTEPPRVRWRLPFLEG